MRDLPARSGSACSTGRRSTSASELGALWAGLIGAPGTRRTDASVLRTYFRPDSRTRPTSAQRAEAALEHLVGQAYRDGGVPHSEPLPLLRRRCFRRCWSALTPPPNVLVIAPRTELRVISSSVLEPMDVAAQEQLEASADSTGVSSLVAPIGGLATYPSMVLEDDSAEQRAGRGRRTSGCTST